MMLVVTSLLLWKLIRKSREELRPPVARASITTPVNTLVTSIYNAWTTVLCLLSEPTLVMRLLPKYGYVAVLLATILEREGTMIAAGAFCRAGYLELRITILAGAIGGA